MEKTSYSTYLQQIVENEKGLPDLESTIMGMETLRVNIE